MATSSNSTDTPPREAPKSRHLGRWIALGLVLGVLCGVVFGEYCSFLEFVGQAYVGLLQMTVLPYLVLSLVAKMGRLNATQARQLGLAVVAVLAVFWLVGILLIVGVSSILPSMPGASFFSPAQEHGVLLGENLLLTFIPANVFRSLSEEFVPGVVVFCLFFGVALIPVPGKEPLLNFLDLCTDAIGRINALLVRLAPIGLFALTAAAAGTLRVDELSRLQAYLVLFTLGCLAAAFGVLPLLVSSTTTIGYRAVLRAAQEPMLTAIATGKLFVVLPQIVENCEKLLEQEEGSLSELGESTANIVVPLAYPFPHLGKILAFVFISFAAWYVGSDLDTVQTATMASGGVVSSFASPLVTIPFMLDQYQLPQDLMPLFILPGFVTTRMADVVGVVHLMALTLIVSAALQGRLRIQWMRLALGCVIVVVSLGSAGVASRWYLSRTTHAYDLDKRLMSLRVPDRYDDVVVYRTGDDVPERLPVEGGTLDRVKSQALLRVGYHPDHLPYTFFNKQGELVGLDVELIHRLAAHLQVRLEFVPYEYDTVVAQLDRGEIDLAVGGMLMNPSRLMLAEFTQPYQLATLAVVLPDHRRAEFESWHEPQMASGLRLGVAQADLAIAAERHLPGVEIVPIDSVSEFFEGRHKELDGLIVAAEEGSAWNVLHPEFTVVIPRPVVRRPVGMIARGGDLDWIRFCDRWLDFERLDGSFDRLRSYWIEGGGTEEKSPRWCVVRDLLHWVR